MRRLVSLLVLSVAVAVLHLAPPATPAFAVETTDVCGLNPAGSNCPPTYPAPELLNPGALAAATPGQAAALRRLTEQAIDNTLADHQLPESDRAAVRTWARADAQVELFALIVAAIDKAETERMADEQQAVQWMEKLVRDQSQVAAERAAEEYASWAGLDLETFRALIRNNATEEQLKTFLSGTVTPYDDTNTSQAKGGYCVYRSPAPYETDYEGWKTSTCSAPCPSVTVCNPPTPKYDDFVKWGQAEATDDRLQTAEFALTAADIATASTFAATLAVASAIGAIVGTSAAFAGFLVAGGAASIAIALAPFYAIDSYLLVEGVITTTTAAISGGVGSAVAAVIGAAVAIIILAIVIAVLEGINVGDAAALPGRLASLVVNTRTVDMNLPHLIDTTEGATTIFSSFVGATLPLPRNDEKCDNSLIPPTAYTNGLGSTMVYLPLGDGVHEEQLSTRPCLNPPDVPAAAVTDPHFVVRNPATNTFTNSSTIALGDPTHVTRVRVHGNWFIASAPGSATEYQGLGLRVTDWEGDKQRVWLAKDDTGRYVFLGVSADSTSALDPDTCEGLGLCWTSRRIQYVDPAGTELEASMEAYQPTAGTPSVHLTPTSGQPVEASPVSFRANGFAPAGAALPVTYQWRFQKDICGHPCPSSIDPQAPSYDDPVAGDPATHTWQTSGTYLVQLTATDRNGTQAVTAFPVSVATVPPVLTVESADATAKTAVPVTLRGTVDHVGQLDSERVWINWGDGSPPETVGAGPNIINVVGQPLRLESFNTTRDNLTATHTYPQPGTYYGTLSVVDQGGTTDVELFRYTIGDDQP